MTNSQDNAPVLQPKKKFLRIPIIVVVIFIVALGVLLFSLLGGSKIALPELGASTPVPDEESQELVVAAQVAIAQDDPEQALEAVSEAIDKDAGNPGAYLQRAKILLDAGKPAEALEDLRNAAAGLPEDPEVYYYQGVAHFKMEQYEDARLMLTRAIDLRLDYADAYYWRAMTNGKLGNWGMTVTDLDIFLGYHPTDPNGLLEHGKALMQTGRMQDAANDFRLLISLQPDQALVDEATSLLGQTGY